MSKTAEQIKGEIRNLLDGFAITAGDTPSMCWDTHLTDTAEKILATIDCTTCQTQIWKEVEAEQKQKLIEEIEKNTPIEGTIRGTSGNFTLRKFNDSWWQQFKEAK